MKKQKKYTLNIRVSEEERDLIKSASEKLHYSGYSEFIRRTTIEVAEKVVRDKTT